MPPLSGTIRYRPTPSLLRIFLVLMVLGFVHVGLWRIATQTHCDVIGVGATECRGGAGLLGAGALYLFAFASVPAFQFAMLRRLGEKHALSNYMARTDRQRAAGVQRGQPCCSLRPSWPWVPLGSVGVPLTGVTYGESPNLRSGNLAANALPW